MLIKIITFYLVIVIGSSAQKYLWPTDASTYLSSSFCEFREGHYHSAIDIKTWLQEGYKCYAVADGKIELIRVSPFGYGKVLYLRLNDGNIAVYAHLKRFSHKVEKMVRAQQLKNEQYRLNWYPKNLYAKKGDIIAYTGRTGIGVPHLHFEIRNNAGNPVNPLKYYSQVKDRLRPKLQSLMVVPLDAQARINSQNTVQVFPLTYIRDGVYIIKKAIKISGRVGLAIRGFDQADDVSNKYGFYQSSLTVDGEDIFKITYDELFFKTTSHIYSEIHYPHWVLNNEVYNKLYIEPYNPSKFYTHYPDQDGSITVGDKSRQFEISIKDFWGNQSTVRGELQADYAIPVNISGYTADSTSVYIQLTSGPIRDLALYSAKEAGRLQTINRFEIIDGKISNPDQGILLKADLADSYHDRLVIRMVSQENETIEKQLYFPVDINPDPEIVYTGNRILVIFYQSIPTGLLVISSEPDVTIAAELTSDGKTRFIIPDPFFNSQKVLVHLVNKQDTLWQYQFDCRLIKAKNTQKIAWYDSAFALTPDHHTFLESFLVEARAEASDSISAVLPVASRIFSLHPATIPVFQNADIEIVADSLPVWGKWALFKTNGTDKLSYIGGRIDPVRLSISANTDPFGNFVIACDTIPPELLVESPVAGQVYRRNPRIKFLASDRHSGIGSEENISLQIDGRFVLPEWDPEDDLVEATIDTALNQGNHTLTISVKDQSGNIMRQAIYFTIN